MIGRVQLGVAEPASNHGDIDASGEQMYGRGMSVRVRSHVFGGERRHPSSGRSDVLVQLEPNARRAKRSTKSVAKDRLILCVRLFRHERSDQIRGFRPDWTDALFATFANESNLRRRIQPQCSWAEIQDLLNPNAGVVEH